MYRSRFPEDLWRVSPENLVRYNKEVECGYGLLSNLNILVCGITRNSVQQLKFNLLRIEYLSRLCNLQSIIYCNDDIESYTLLKSWEKPSRQLIYETLNKEWHGSVSTQSRYIDMAYYRNKYLAAAKNQDFDYLVVLDLDTHGFSYDGFAHSIYCMENSKYNVDFIGSNGLIYQGRKLYYDSLAFRKSGVKLSPTDINLLDYNRGEDLIKVESCFGGLGIYGRKIIDYEYGSDDCDHVTINRNLKCCLNPSMIVLYSDNPYEA